MDTQRGRTATAAMRDDTVRTVLERLRLPAPPAADDPRTRAGVAALMDALSHFAELLPPAERPPDAAELLESVAATNAFEPLRAERALPVTVVFYAGVHPGYFEGDARVGEAAWRLCYTDGGAIGPSKPKERLLDEVIRLAEAMHDKNPFGEVPFDGGKTIVVQEAGSGHFQAVTALYGEVSMPLFILAKGGIRYYPVGDVTMAEKQVGLQRWAASSALADVLATRYVGGPDMRMGEEEMAWVDEAAAAMGAARRRRQLPAVTGLEAGAGGFPHQAWELTGRTVAASLKEALRHPGMARYGLPPAGYPATPIRVLIQGFGDVGGSVARLLYEESPDLAFEVAGVADEWGAVYRASGLIPGELLRLRAERRPITEYGGPLDALWVATPSDADRARPEFRGADSREMILEAADVFIPAAIPNVIDAQVAPRLRVRVVAEGANNAVAPRVEEDLHRLGVLYLPGQAMNWGGVKGSTLEVLFRELTKRSVPFDRVEEQIREALKPLAGGVDVPWAVEVLRSHLPGPPLSPQDTRAFAVAILEDLARSNTRWLMDELAASRNERPPLELVRTLSRNVRALKVQLLSLIEQALGKEFFAPTTTLQRSLHLLDDRFRELLSEQAASSTLLTHTQVVEQRQMLQQLQQAIPRGLSPVLASLLAALDLARQKVMAPESYSQESLVRDLSILRDPDAPVGELEGSLYRVQRVHPGPRRPEFLSALVRLVDRPDLSPVVRRNAAFAIARLGSVDPGDRAALLRGALTDTEPTVRAACHWALAQMGLPAAASGGPSHGDPASN